METITINIKIDLKFSAFVIVFTVLTDRHPELCIWAMYIVKI